VCKTILILKKIGARNSAWATGVCSLNIEDDSTQANDQSYFV